MKQVSDTSVDLDTRLQFMKLDAGASGLIQNVRSIIDRELPLALDQFYDQVEATPQARRFFSDRSHLARAKDAQIRHWDAISSGTFDERYAKNVQRIGETHARIGLEPRWYIGGYALISAHLVGAIVSDLWPKGFIRRGADDAGRKVGAAVGALVKAIMLDMDIAISVYAEMSERARVEGEARAIASERATVVGAFGTALSRLAGKDLTCQMNEALPDAYLQLQSDFNAALAQLASAFQSVTASTNAVHTGANEISTASKDLSRRNEQQASSLEETAAALQEITTTVRKTAEAAQRARKVVDSTHSEANKSGAVVNCAIEAMACIENSSREIGQILGVIDEIAFQTNLLALNAGVEAARAGDAGKGFAVVASEVRALAQRSAEAAKEIKTLVAASSSRVENGVALVREAGQALARIVGQVNEINGVVAEIAASAKEQATGLQEVNTAVGQMDQMTQQNAAMSEEASAASQSLRKESERLSYLVADFEISDSDRGRGEVRTEYCKVTPQRVVVHRLEPTARTKPLARLLRVAPRSRANTALSWRDDDEWAEF